MRRTNALVELIRRGGGDGIELGLVVSGEDPSTLSPLLATQATVGSIELRGALDQVAQWRERAPAAAIFIEGAPVEEVAKLRERDPRIGAKLRCGGLELAAFPSAEAVAAFVESCVRLDVPFKATAGLHQPLRHWDPEIGVHHHGFLNIWAATALTAEGAEAPALLAALEAEDAESWSRLELSAPALARGRRWFTGFGTCSIEEPLGGLAALGLLHG